MSNGLHAVLDDALADFGTPVSPSHLAAEHRGSPPEASAASAAPDAPAPTPRSSSSSQASTSQASTSQAAKASPKFDPLRKPLRTARKPKQASNPPSVDRAAPQHAHQAAAAYRAGPADPLLGAVPPDLSDLPEEMSQRLSELMNELAQVDPHRLGEPASSSGATRGQEAEVSATLRQLAEQSRLHAGGAGADAGGNGILDDAMFDRLGAELEGLGGGEGGLGSLAETIMHQLLSKEVLYQPMKEIGSRYPSYLAQHQKDVPEEDFKRFQAQFEYIQQICELYENSPNDSARLFALVQAMQACGSPPEELVSELSPGLSFDSDGLPTFGSNPDPAQCCLQ